MFSANVEEKNPALAEWSKWRQVESALRETRQGRAEHRWITRLTCPPKTVTAHNAWNCWRHGHVRGVKRLAARVVHESVRVRRLQKGWKKPGKQKAYIHFCLLACLYERWRVKRVCVRALVCVRVSWDGSHALLGALWFYRLTDLWPDIKWFPVPSSVCCQFNCPSAVSSPRPPGSAIWSANLEVNCSWHQI